MSRFSDLAERTAKRFIMPEKPEPPSASEKLEDLVREWARDATCREIILPWLSVHIKRVELAEDSAITNHPLMLTLHGQVMALKQLRDILSQYSNPNLEP